jgi:hypothetical protein
MTEPRFEPNTSRIWVKSVIATTRFVHDMLICYFFHFIY